MKCSQCFGSGMVQTGSFGPKPCPNCQGSSFVYDSHTPESKPKYTLLEQLRNMSIGTMILVSVFAGLISLAFWPDLKGLPGGLVLLFLLGTRY